MDTDYVSAKEYLQSGHYYGKIVRKFFLFGGFLMLVTLPFFSSEIPVTVVISILAIVAMIIVSGLLSPITREVVVANLVVASLATIVFEYESVILYSSGLPAQSDLVFFAINQILAINFLFATYYGSKTLRGAIFKAKYVSSEN